MQNRITHFFPRKSAFRLQISVLTLTRFLEGDRAAVNQKASSAETGFGKFNEVASSVHADCGSGLRASGNVPKIVRIAP